MHYTSNYYETSNYQIVRYFKDKDFVTLCRNRNQNRVYSTNVVFPFYQPISAIDVVYNDFFVHVMEETTWISAYIKEQGDLKGVYSTLNVLKEVKDDNNPVLFFVRFK